MARIRADRVAEMLGVPIRTVQDLAARGELPAAKIGRSWTFDEGKVAAWLERKEAETCRRAVEVESCRKGATGGAKPSGGAARSVGSKRESPYAQAMSKLLGAKPRNAARA
jgi:excisionase family DNA binding protein